MNRNQNDFFFFFVVVVVVVVFHVSAFTAHAEYIFKIFQLSVTARLNRSFTCEWNMHVTVPLLVNGSCTCEQDPGHTIYHAISHQTIAYTMPYLARPVYIRCDALKAIPFTMPCPPDHIIYLAMPFRPYHISRHARQIIPYTCHTARPHHIPPIPR